MGEVERQRVSSLNMLQGVRPVGAGGLAATRRHPMHSHFGCVAAALPAARWSLNAKDRTGAISPPSSAPVREWPRAERPAIDARLFASALPSRNSIRHDHHIRGACSQHRPATRHAADLVDLPYTRPAAVATSRSFRQRACRWSTTSGGRASRTSGTDLLLAREIGDPEPLPRRLCQSASFPHADRNLGRVGRDSRFRGSLAGGCWRSPGPGPLPMMSAQGHPPRQH